MEAGARARSTRSAAPSSAATGSVSTRWFHALLAGKTGQRGAPGTRSALRGRAAEQRAPTAREHRQPLTQRASCRRAASPSRVVPSPSPALELDRAAVLVDERARDREPEARCPESPARVAVARAEEAREDLALLVGRDADAGVGDDDAARLSPVAADARPSPCRRRRLNLTAFETRLSSTCAEPARVAERSAADGRRRARARRPSRSAARPHRLDATASRARRGRPARARARPASPRSARRAAGPRRAGAAGRCCAGSRRGTCGRSRRARAPRPGASRGSRRSTSAACAARATRSRRTRRASGRAPVGRHLAERPDAPGEACRAGRRSGAVKPRKTRPVPASSNSSSSPRPGESAISSMRLR